jgi:integrase
VAIVAAKRREFRSWWHLTQSAQNGKWYISGTPPGRDRIRQSTGRRNWDEAFDEAEKIAAAIDAKRERVEHLRAAGLDPAKDAVNDVTLATATIDYMAEHGNSLPPKSQDNIRGYNTVLLTFFGQKAMLSSIGMPQVAKFAAWLEEGGMVEVDPDHYRLLPSPRTINAYLGHLRALMNYAKEVWHCVVQDIRWAKKRGKPGMMKKQPPPPTRVIHEGEEEADLRVALDADTVPVFEFSFLTSVRRGNAIFLKKSQVDWRAREIRFKQKGDRNHTVFITPKIEALLRAEWNNHPVYVFTYVCKRNRNQRYTTTTGKQVAIAQVKGGRYPFTESILRDRWVDAKKRAGIVDTEDESLTWHSGTRRTRITRVIRNTGNAKLAQRMAGHSDITTTLKSTTS